MTDTSSPQVLSYSLAPSTRGYGVLAVGGTFLFPGVGHLITGFYRRGAIWLTISLAMKVLWLAMICDGIVLVGFGLHVVDPLLSIGIAIDAFVMGRRSSRSLFSSAWPRYGLGVLLIVVGISRLKVENLAIVPIELKHLHTYVVRTKPMLPTITPGDYVLVATGVQPKRWDIVAFYVPIMSPTGPQNSIQRVVGLPGETLEITTAGLKIDGKLVNLPPNVGPYAQPRPPWPGNGCQGNPISLGPDEFFILGDNTAISNDSRYWQNGIPGHQLGALPASQIIGVVEAICWPPSQFQILRR